MKFPCVLENSLLIIRVHSGLSFAIKRIGPPCCTLLYLLLFMNYLAIKTICYRYFQYLLRIPWWKPLVISFCSSLGSTLLLIERTTIDPLYLWVIIRSNEALWAPWATRAPPLGSAVVATALSSCLLPKLLVSLMSRKKSPKSFVAFGLHLVLIFWKTKNRQKTATGTGH